MNKLESFIDGLTIKPSPYTTLESSKKYLKDIRESKEDELAVSFKNPLKVELSNMLIYELDNEYHLTFEINDKVVLGDIDNVILFNSEGFELINIITNCYIKVDHKVLKDKFKYFPRMSVVFNKVYLVVEIPKDKLEFIHSLEWDPTYYYLNYNAYSQVMEKHRFRWVTFSSIKSFRRILTKKTRFEISEINTITNFKIEGPIKSAKIKHWNETLDTVPSTIEKKMGSVDIAVSLELEKPLNYGQFIVVEYVV